MRAAVDTPPSEVVRFRWRGLRWKLIQKTHYLAYGKTSQRFGVSVLSIMEQCLEEVTPLTSFSYRMNQLSVEIKRRVVFLMGLT